ncbi:hypothetical protein [Sulfitobacter geojensis]|uniref:hypothetical protein n=1 Tax=Sulfitobacter geojensis TaxID=1342299 RepID=UPI0007D98C83|nr:hypothetical protein [Sulfitobacter geojensis]OAN98073.1 hypothetical protein A8B74_01690 [Sulfitobacter geojensis]
MDDEQLRAHIARNEDCKNRHDALALKLEVQAKEKWSVTVSRDAFLALPAFRLFVLTGEMIGDVEHEMERDLDQVRQAKKTSEVQAALSDIENEDHDSAIASLNALKPHERMAKAREMGAVQQPSRHAPAPQVNDPVERAKIIYEINKLPVSMRIAAARERGVA